MSKLSLYADSLPPDAKARYLYGIERIGGPDPFSSDFVGDKSEIVPPVSTSMRFDIVFSTADQFITSKQFKAYRSLEAYNQLVCGWVKAFKRMPIV